MIAYKFLRAGSIGRFSDVPWPAAGQWLEVAGALDACVSGVHATSLDALAYWFEDELWTVELDGEILDLGTVLVARRGRLVARIEAWPQVSPEFARDCATHAQTLAERTPVTRGSRHSPRKPPSTPSLQPPPVTPSSLPTRPQSLPTFSNQERSTPSASAKAVESPPSSASRKTRRTVRSVWAPVRRGGHAGELAGRNVGPSGTVRRQVERDVDVADNDNKSCASPGHHGHTIWRCFAASVVEAKPHD